jgi:4-diphosphocytidyl-2-C-methyl-D-erythritol kinase
MITYPNAKINIGLHIIEKRPDGYHNIETVFYPVELFDILEINPAEGKQDQYEFTGIDTGCANENNICVKAVNLMRKHYKIPPVNLHLHKQIPHGTGLGGGSSDAAFTLTALNTMFNLALPDEKLEELALVLGSDCPFFIRNKPALAKGRGEELSPLSLNLDNYTIKFAFPGFNISTAHAYSKVKPATPARKLAELIELPVKEWKGKIVNDFEKAMAGDFQQIDRIITKFYREGAIYSSLSGSGSAVYGVFEKEKT